MSAIARITTPGEIRRPVPRCAPDAVGAPRGSGLVGREVLIAAKPTSRCRPARSTDPCRPLGDGRGPAVERAVVDRHVVGEPGAGHRRAERLPEVAERLREKALAVLDGLERPEAVDHPDLEAAAQERAIP